jgi:hypothetical protein
VNQKFATHKQYGNYGDDHAIQPTATGRAEAQRIENARVDEAKRIETERADEAKRGSLGFRKPK